MTTFHPFYPQYIGPPPVKRKSIYRPLLTGQAGVMMRRVAAAYKVGVNELCGPSTERRLSRPRQELMFLLYDTGRYSYPQIGLFLGGRDHTTVIHGVQAHRKRLAQRLEAAQCQ
jgi:chromosomal replication initiator protein